MFDYRVEDFEILRFFSYTSTIPAKDRIFCYDGMNHSGNWHPNIREKFDIFEDALVEYATEIWKEHTGKDCYMRFMDNKTVFQLRHKYSGEIIFIGHYDMYRFVGKSCYLHDVGKSPAYSTVIGASDYNINNVGSETHCAEEWIVFNYTKQYSDIRKILNTSLKEDQTNEVRPYSIVEIKNSDNFTKMIVDSFKKDYKTGYTEVKLVEICDL
jgi:hypothetical protein